MEGSNRQVIIIHFKACNRSLYKRSVAILFGGWGVCFMIKMTRQRKGERHFRQSEQYRQNLKEITWNVLGIAEVYIQRASDEI